MYYIALTSVEEASQSLWQDKDFSGIRFSKKFPMRNLYREPSDQLCSDFSRPWVDLRGLHICVIPKDLENIWFPS